MIHQFNAKLIFRLFLIIILCLNGCSNTITNKDLGEVEITFNITFDTQPNFINNNYYIVYGNSSDIDINYLVSGHYFFIPGESYEASIGNQISSSGINYFYDTFFESWAGILTLKSEDLSITEGTFSSSSKNDEEDRITDHLTYTNRNLSSDNYNYTSNGTLTFTIPASSLNLSSDLLYFTIITTTGNHKDNINDLVSNIQEVPLISNTPPVTGTHDTSSFPQTTSAAKIISWTISVQ